MRKILITLLLIPLLSISSYSENKTAENENRDNSEKTISKAEAKQLIGRLHEIHEMVRGENLSADQKDKLRNEVLGIRDRLEKMSGVYIYLSATAILIIILILLLL